MLTRICETLGIDVPIFAFSHCRDVVAAVTNAGGLGVLGATGHSPRALEIDLTWIDNQTKGKPYGVDLLLPAKFADAATDRNGGRDGEGGLADRDTRARAGLFPPEHEAFVEALLRRYQVPALPEHIKGRRAASGCRLSRWATCSTWRSSIRSGSSRAHWGRRPRS